MPKPKSIVVATDIESGFEAIYVNGRLAMEDQTIYACDIASQADNGKKSVTLRHISVEDSGPNFPKLLKTLETRA